MTDRRVYKLERAIKKLSRAYGQIGKVRRWLDTTNDYRGAERYLEDRRINVRAWCDATQTYCRISISWLDEMMDRLKSKEQVDEDSKDV